MRARLLRLPLLVTMTGIAGLAMLLPAAHASVSGQDRVAQAFLYSGVMVLVLAGMVGLATANRRPQNVARSQLGALVGAYLVLPAVLALPLAQAVPDTSYGNALFEMVSAFTTTGATVYDLPGRLVPSLHLWRALVGWLGGLFMLVAASAILAPMHLGGIEVLSGRAPGRGQDGVGQHDAGQGTRIADPAERFLRYTQLLTPVYLALTLLLWLCLMVAGEVNLVALVHAMGTVSTSGIGMEGDLDVLQSGLWGEGLIFLFLMLAISRRFLPAVPARVQGRLIHDPEIRLAFGLVILVTAVLFLRHFIAAAGTSTPGDPGTALRAFWGALFTAVSFLTTTGYESGEWLSTRNWSGLTSPGLVLMGLAIIGGGVATTAGGVKLLRVYALYLHGQREIEKLVHPSSIGHAPPHARHLGRESGYFAWLFFMLFALSIAASVLALALAGLEFDAALVVTLSALTTTGQLADVAGENPIRYAELGGLAKAVTGTMMVVGRLETLAILALLAPSGWRR